MMLNEYSKTNLILRSSKVELQSIYRVREVMHSHIRSMRSNRVQMEMKARVDRTVKDECYESIDIGQSLFSSNIKLGDKLLVFAAGKKGHDEKTVLLNFVLSEIAERPMGRRFKLETEDPDYKTLNFYLEVDDISLRKDQKITNKFYSVDSYDHTTHYDLSRSAGYVVHKVPIENVALPMEDSVTEEA